jgi:benzodiazapine receptor
MRQIAREQELPWLLGLLGASYGAAALGSLFTFRALNSWYHGLPKPRWTPPDRVFGPVWTLLYTHMAVAAWLVRRGMARPPGTKREVGRWAFFAWSMQLLLNVGWSAVFFGRRNPGAALWVIAPLWLAIATTAVLGARVSRLAGVLLLPYLAWTSFAAALNVQVWRLNR